MVLDEVVRLPVRSERTAADRVHEGVRRRVRAEMRHVTEGICLEALIGHVPVRVLPERLAERPGTTVMADV